MADFSKLTHNGTTYDVKDATARASIGQIAETVLDKVDYDDIVDNLTTEDGQKPLSAKQGKVLNSSIGAINTNIGTINENISGLGERVDAIEEGTYHALLSSSTWHEFISADECAEDTNTVITYCLEKGDGLNDRSCRYLGKANDRDGYAVGFRFMNGTDMEIVTVWFKTTESAQELEFTPIDRPLTVTYDSANETLTIGE